MIHDYAAILRSYHISAVMSDDYGGGGYSDDWRRNDIEFKKCPYDKSELYLRSLPLLTSKRALLLDHGRLRTQLAGLERRVLSGHEKIDHAQTASAHDDIANAVCGVLVQAARRGDYDEPGHVMPFVVGTPRHIPGQHSCW